jgi:lysophospholipid acyltransferase 5
MEQLSELTGVAEPGLRLLVALLTAYPMAAFQRSFLLKDSVSPSLRNTANVISGMAIAYIFCQENLIHSFITITATYAICYFTQQWLPVQYRWTANSLNFVFNFGYLLLAYYYYASEEYDINWTTPQSVLTLRLIGFGFDFADGTKHLKTKKKEEPVDSGTDQIASKAAKKESETIPVVRKETEDNRVPTAWAGDLSLPQLPSYWEMLGYCYFGGSFLIGPQFSFALYRRYLNLDLFKTHTPIATGAPSTIAVPMNNLLASARGPALRSFLVGVVYLGVTQVLQAKFPSSMVLTSDFQELPFLHRAFLGWWAGKTAMSKYLGVWLLTESACILNGISFDGLTTHGQPRWSGLANINIVGYEMATSLNQIVAYFNVNTNHWAKLYIFKRLRFLGNKNLSAAGTLVFLSIWHGFHAGYAFCFALEFMAMEAERRLKRMASPVVQLLAKYTVGNILVNIACWLLTTGVLYYAMLGFDLLTSRSLWIAYTSLYFYVHIGVIGVIALSFVYPGPSSKPPKVEPKKTQ